MKRTELKRGTTSLNRTPMARGAKRIPQRSAKMVQAYSAPGGRRELVAMLLTERPYCEARVVCAGARSVDVHERLSRARGGNILDPVQAHMLTICRPCHDWVTTHPKAAEERRLALPSWHRCPPVGPC